jgi:malonate-semialdehyde dehydrogenase (acetylating)/methylmalonate-semialdehyde dehydrogenase
MATLQMGEFVPNASNGIDTYCIREPLGVCAGICPFNFPAMIPLWVCAMCSKFFSFINSVPCFSLPFLDFISGKWWL